LASSGKFICQECGLATLGFGTVNPVRHGEERERLEIALGGFALFLTLRLRAQKQMRALTSELKG
jgi:hypothetical protein